METLFLICAVAGGSLLIIQVLLLMIGFDSGGETEFELDGADIPDDISDYEVDSGESAQTQDASAAAFKFLSMKTLVAFFTFFGLAGLLGLEYDLGTAPSLTLAIVSGLVAFYLVGYVWMLLYRLQTRGNIDMRNALGRTGRVYLRIPPRGEGVGKVTLDVQGRTVEVSALTTEGDEIPTGDRIRVVGIAGEDTVKVVPLRDLKEASHGN